MHIFCVDASPTLPAADEGARMNKLEAVVATEVILPDRLLQLSY